MIQGNGILPKNKDITTALIEAFTSIKENGLFSIHKSQSLITGLFYVSLIMFVITVKLFFNKKKTLFGKEHGTARWATLSEKRKLMDTQNPDNNIILTNDVFLSMNTRKTRKNNNIICVGGSGSGKTRYFCKPNLLQACCSYVMTDPKGELLKSLGKVFEKLGYVVKVFNLIEMVHSDCYNPFVYIHKQSDVLKLINQLIKNTNPPDMKGSSDPFWEKSETALLQAIFFFLWLCCPKEQQNFKTVMELIDVADASEEDENKLSDLDKLFNKLEEEYGSDFIAVKQYHIFKKASGKTAKSILISVGVRLSVFNIEAIKNITYTDSLQLNKCGDRKTALFIVIPDSDTTFNFLVSMLYSQLFDELYFQADFGELEWKDNKIIYRTFESIAQKKNRLLKLCNTLWNCEGNKKKLSTYNKILSLFNAIHKECGMPIPKTSKIEDINKAMIKKYTEKLVPYMIRLKDRIRTLKKYIYDLNRYLDHISHHEKLESVSKGKVISNIRKIEKQLFFEYGLKIEDQAKNSKKNNEFQIEGYFSLLSQMKKLLNYMEVGKAFGSRQSFDDKCVAIDDLEKQINKYKKEIKETSFLQFSVRKRINEKIQASLKAIKQIEYTAEFEFGIKNLRSRRKNGGRLPIPVRCMLDEFANISPIPDFQKLVATMRSREISVSIIIQNIAQLKEMYKDAWESITGNCDSFLFLGGQEQSTLEYVSKKLGKQTIDKRSTGDSKGRSGTFSQNWDVLGRELSTADEIGCMEDTKCILFIRGMRPCFSDKFDLKSHNRYPLMGETDDPSDLRLFDYKNKFNTLEIIKNQMKKADICAKEMKKIFEECKHKAINRLKSELIITSGKTLNLNDFTSGNVTLADDSILLGSPNERYRTLQTTIISGIKKYCSKEINFNDRTLSDKDVLSLLQDEGALKDIVDIKVNKNEEVKTDYEYSFDLSDVKSHIPDPEEQNAIQEDYSESDNENNSNDMSDINNVSVSEQDIDDLCAEATLQS